MQTIDLETASQKGRKISEFLDGLHHFESATSRLAAYHAAQAVKAAVSRVGVDRQVTAAKKALKAFDVMVSFGQRAGRAGPCVRLYSPRKQIEVLL
jgi:hypothetical protein